ncbi:hypothetical protein L6164_014897 [Bauhinia variegata]|uniref:Uncharacterized protein n=1 Tax=Bauhinia variegata TaxID=167791 RepID=A0ACB9NKX6_BAUVA|nr:hypothetical protein L6164_014897 [Bauhinia variegata]
MEFIFRCWRWILKLINVMFRFRILTSIEPQAQPPPELCNDILFEIFLRLPPEELPRFSCLNKQCFAIINSTLFKNTYWANKICLPRLYAIVYYQQRWNNRISFALMIREYQQRLNKGDLHKYRQLPPFPFPFSSHNRLLQWADSLLQNNKIGAPKTCSL